ncbi:GTPase ObgE [Candidatus Peregrinibacteria bacterium]|nr:GTPase ObgE [Candidatus Peregrinibacteria bacterium]
MFCDQARVTFIAGKGGNGCVSFRREKFIAKGGPDGGDGGNGGNIVLRANENLTTLSDFKTKKQYKAQSGQPGRGKNQHGKNADDLYLDVPVGTMVYDKENEKLYADLNENNKTYIVVHGGQGGKGNARFASSTLQAPKFAEIGEPGEERTLQLELKLIADVGFIGLPSAGKSTLISAISNAKPKIADYPFTTLIPHLGIVDVGAITDTNIKDSFVAADIPGLIKGASHGKGLGDEFLKHVSRTKVLIHVIDIQQNDIVKSYETINKELVLFDKTLAKKPQIIALNKIDTVDDETVTMLVKHIKKSRDNITVYPISAVVGKGLKKLILATYKLLTKEREKVSHISEESVSTHKIHRPHLKKSGNRFEISLSTSKKDNQGKRTFIIKGKNIEKMVQMTDFNNEQAVQRIYTHLDQSGATKQLKEHGAQEGDSIRIINKTLPFRT